MSERDADFVGLSFKGICRLVGQYGEGKEEGKGGRKGGKKMWRKKEERNIMYFL